MTDDAIDVQPADSSILDGGYARIPTYWLLYWRPYLSLGPAALWELLTSYCHGSRDLAHPSITTLAASLGTDRRTLVGRVKADRAYPGWLDSLVSAGLLTCHYTGGRPAILFRVLRTPPLLTPAQVRTLPSDVQRRHGQWLDRHQPLGYPTLVTHAGSGMPTQADTPAVGYPTQSRGYPTRIDQSNRETERSNDAETLTPASQPLAGQIADSCSYAQPPASPIPAPAAPVLAVTTWAAIVDQLQLTTRLKSTVSTLAPIDLQRTTDGAHLILRAPSTTVRDWWSTEDAATAIRTASPIPLAAITVTQGIQE